MPLLSVIVPLYNKASTVEEVLAALVAKQVPGGHIEVGGKKVSIWKNPPTWIKVWWKYVILGK